MLSLAMLTLVCLVGASLAGCSSDEKTEGDSGAVTLTVYSGQHEDMVGKLADAFRKETSISLDIRSGSDSELVNQIIEEGDRSKADLVLTEEPGPMGQLDKAGLLASVTPSTLAKPDQRFVPGSGNWLPWAGRSRVIFYNPNTTDESKLPASILDLSKPEWKGRFAYAPSGAFTSTVAYLIGTIGSDRTLEWLKGIKANGVNEQSNGKIRDSVEAGQHEFGLSNHYYWYVMAKDKGGEQAVDSRVHYMSGKDAGALVLASGAGVIKSSADVEAAQRFLAWLVSPDGGQRIVAQDSPQYPLVDGVASSFDLKPLQELDPPQFDQGALAVIDEAQELMIKAGLV